MFENQINWNEPITLVEGVFDVRSEEKFLTLYLVSSYQKN